MNAQALDPWRVICGQLLELSGYEIPEVLDRTGLVVDWSLSEKENYSQSTRKAAYRPRINAGYAALSRDDQLRVAYIVARELASKGYANQLNSKLEMIGWSVREGRLTAVSSDVKELFFPSGTPHDAYVQVRNIIKRAVGSISIVDPYLDSSVFELLSSLASNVASVRLLSFKMPGDFHLEARKFASQRQIHSIEVRQSKEFHDRFIVLDGTECWHVGASIKDAGSKAFMISQVEDKRNRDAITKHLTDAWVRAATISP